MSYISAGTTLTTSLVQGGDTTGNLIFATGNANTTALTINNSQAATFAGNVTAGNISATGNVTSAGTITATGNLIIGSSLVYANGSPFSSGAPALNINIQQNYGGF